MDSSEKFLFAAFALLAITMISFAFVIIGAVTGWWAFDFGISEGSIRGKVIDQEYAGLFSKNQIFHVQTTYDDTHQFTICKSNPNLEEQVALVRNAQLNGKEVVVHYKDRFFYTGAECDVMSTPIVSVELAK